MFLFKSSSSRLDFYGPLVCRFGKGNGALYKIYGELVFMTFVLELVS